VDGGSAIAPPVGLGSSTGMPHLTALGALGDEDNLPGAHDHPTKAAIEVPTASIGFDPDATSST
jgi:hypothetical protein